MTLTEFAQILLIGTLDGGFEIESPSSDGYHVENLLSSPIVIRRINSESDFRVRRISNYYSTENGRDLVIHVVAKGHLKLSFSNDEFTVSGGQFYLQDPRNPFRAAAFCDAQNAFESLHICVPEVLFLAHLSERHQHLAPQTFSGPNGLAALSILEVLGAHGGQISPKIAAGLTDCLLVAIGNELDENGAIAPRSRHFLTRRFAEIERLISSRFADANLSVKCLAKELSVSERTLANIFRAKNTSFSDLLWTTRTNHARALLTSPGVVQPSIEEIAARCGFKSVAHFSRKFKAEIGVTPSRFRYLHSLG